MFALTSCVIFMLGIVIVGNNSPVLGPVHNTSNVLVWANHTLKLNCLVTKEDHDKIVWKKDDDELLAVGSVIFTTNQRINVNIGGTLQVERVQKSDSGFYLCQSGGRNDQNMKHVFSVNVQDFRCPLLIAPKHGTIRYTHKQGKTPFTSGTTAIYICERGYTLSDNEARNCTEKNADEYPWDGHEPLCVAEELIQLEKRMSLLESHIDNQNTQESNLFKEKQLGAPADRVSRLEQEISSFLRKQEDLKEWMIKTMQILNSSSAVETSSNATDGMLHIQHQLNEMWMRVTLLHNQLQTRMDDLEKTVDEASEQSINFLKEPNMKATSRLTDLSSLVSIRLGFLENETKNLEEVLFMQNKLLEHVDETNMIATAWEESQKVSMARMRLLDGDKVVWEYIWVVHNIEGKIKKSLESGHFSTQSNAFYTGVPGYRFRMVLYPNFGESNQIGLFAGLLPGEFDEQIPWPFNWDYHMSVISHDPEKARDHVGVISMPPVTCDVINFQRPITGAAPSACGFRHFLSHGTLNDQHKAYITNGHLWIRIRIYTR